MINDALEMLNWNDFTEISSYWNGFGYTISDGVDGFVSRGFVENGALKRLHWNGIN